MNGICQWPQRFLTAIAISLISLPAFAADCKYISGIGMGTIQFTGDHVAINWRGRGKQICDFSIGGGDEGGNTITCPGEDPASFTIVGRTLGSTDPDILFFEETAWYRDPKCK